jgi:hypothetical protein
LMKKSISKSELFGDIRGKEVGAYKNGVDGKSSDFENSNGLYIGRTRNGQR